MCFVPFGAGVPSTCDAKCAVFFVSFYNSCEAYMALQSSAAVVAGLAHLATTCEEQLPIEGLLHVAAECTHGTFTNGTLHSQTNNPPPPSFSAFSACARQ